MLAGLAALISPGRPGYLSVELPQGALVAAPGLAAVISETVGDDH